MICIPSSYSSSSSYWGSLASIDLTIRPLWYNHKKVILLWLSIITVFSNAIFLYKLIISSSSSIFSISSNDSEANYLYPVEWFIIVVCVIEISSQLMAILGSLMPNVVCLLLYMISSILTFMSWLLITFQIRLSIILLYLSFVRCLVACSFLIDVIQFKFNRIQDNIELSKL